jgi:hypothetical protein
MRHIRDNRVWKFSVLFINVFPRTLTTQLSPDEAAFSFARRGASPRQGDLWLYGYVFSNQLSAGSAAA